MPWTMGINIFKGCIVEENSSVDCRSAVLSFNTINQREQWTFILFSAKLSDQLLVNKEQCSTVLYNFVQQGLQWCTMVFHSVEWCSKVYSGVQWSTVVYNWVKWCTLYSSIQWCTVVYDCVQWYTMGYNGLHWCTVVYNGVKWCIIVYDSIW